MSMRLWSNDEGQALTPVEFYPGSNGEAPPEPPTAAQIQGYGAWQALVETQHRHVGTTRREFAESACGMAAALLVMQQAGCGHSSGQGSPKDTGGPSAVTPDMTRDAAAARERLSGDEFIVDVHTHPPNGRLLAPWPDQSPQQEALDYIKMMFVQSDVAVSVITGWPDARPANEANVKANATLQELTDRLGGARFLFHANANPDLEGEPNYIEGLASKFKNIAAWKVYPQENRSKRLHQYTDFLERVRTTGIKIVAAHRGIHHDEFYEDPGSPEDVVRAALLFPDIKFLMYHSGYEKAQAENHAYQDLGAQTKGVDRFVKAMLWAREQNGGRPVTNVFADVGTTWASVMGNDSTAGHLLGKLLKYVGPDQVLFGTDSFNGSLTPQAQIARLRTFDIPEPLREAHGYPALTPEVRRKMMGLNAAGVYHLDPKAVRYKIKDDDIAKLKQAFNDDPRSVPMPHPHRYRGPRNRRDFLGFVKWERKAWG